MLSLSKSVSVYDLLQVVYCVNLNLKGRVANVV